MSLLDGGVVPGVPNIAPPLLLAEENLLEFSPSLKPNSNKLHRRSNKTLAL
jgi:hypothetical protein